jgi:predicted ATPase
MLRIVLARAREQSHHYSLAFGLLLGSVTMCFARDFRGTRELAEAAIALSFEHGFDEVRIFCEGQLGWALCEQGRIEDGIAGQRDSLDALLRIGGCPGLTQTRAHLAHAYGRVGRIDEAHAELELAFDLMRQTNERFYEPELQRIGGELHLLAKHGAAESERCFRVGIDTARRQGAKLWELRASTSLARLLRDTGRRDEGRAMLGEIYNWFTEGFDTADLKDAKALLDELNG